LRDRSSFQDRGPGCLIAGVDHVKHVNEPKQENDKQDNLKKHKIKMTHHPPIIFYAPFNLQYFKIDRIFYA